MNTGKTYLFKDGKVIFINLTMSEDDVEKACVDIKTRTIIPLVSSEERSLNDSISPVNTNPIDIYRQYIDIGYSVIRYIKPFDIDYERATLTLVPKCDCVIALNITDLDAYNIQGVFEMLEPKKAFDKGCLYNVSKNIFDKLDYDYYDPSENRGIFSSEILPYFLKEKTGKLSDEEKKVIHKYRDFNLENLLIEDIPKENKLNNDNLGVIIITTENMYFSTCKKRQHRKEIDMIFDYLRPDIDMKMSIQDLVDETRSVVIQVSKGELAITFPKHLKNYQINQMKNLLEIIRQLNIKTKENIVLSASESFNGKTNKVVRTSYQSSTTDTNKLLDDLNKYLDNVSKNSIVRGSKII